MKTKETNPTRPGSPTPSSLYTNIPQEEGINTVCKAYQTFYGEHTPIPTQSLRRILKLILQENSLEFNGKNYLQTHGTAIGTKMAVTFANIFMSAVETKILNLSKTKPLERKRYIDDIFALWRTDRKEIDEFIAPQGAHTICLYSRLLFYSKCTGFWIYRLLHL